ncbi:MAG TPA: phage holin family protein [Actinomycetota bacterium]|nr:phage holin family protein [Actinomycetota bacterium]
MSKRPPRRSSPPPAVADARLTQQEDDLTDRGLPELLRMLAEQTSTLVKQELDLARAELTQKGKRAGAGFGFLGAAGGLGFFAFACLTAAIVLLISLVLPAWLSALIVAAVYGGAAAALGMRGKDKVQDAAPPVPEQAQESVKQDVESVKEDIRWARNQNR